MSAPEPWRASEDAAGELARVIRHARLCTLDADHQLAHLDGVLARHRAQLLPESVMYFTVELAAAQHRRNLWGAKLEELEAYARLMAEAPPPTADDADTARE